MVMNEVRRYMEAAVEKLTPSKAQQMARSVMQGQGKEQVQKVAQDLMEWSNHTRERMAEMVRREVARQLKAMGVATRSDLDALKRRVRELERGGAGAKATTKRPSAKKPAAKRSTAARSTPKAPTASGEGGS